VDASVFLGLVFQAARPLWRPKSWRSGAFAD
jgi:hypothetical protein